MARSRRDTSFDEWLKKSPARGGTQTAIAPGAGMVGRYAPPGSPVFDSFQSQSKYALEPREQPQPWIDDVDMGSNWYSPFQPVWPFGPPYVNQPREWDFPTGYNLNYINARMQLMEMLRAMRNGWGVLATVIATRQDQLLRIPWTIQVRDKPRAKNAGVEAMRRFFKRPDGKLSYSQWTRKLTDDLLVIDAPTLWFPRDMGGRVLAAEVINGATIFPLIDDTGRRPDSKVTIDEDGITYLQRQPAFQQIIKGQPMIDLDESELLYCPMRPRPEMPIFGYAPTEQILNETVEAVLKTGYQRKFWDEGTIPDLIVTVPNEWTPRQIAMFQAHFDAMLSGNLNLKSKVRFLPGGMKPFDIKNSSGESLWSQRDEMLIRLCCYAYSVSPTPFIHQTNRACYSADTETLTEFGWRKLEDIQKGEKIATVNPQTACLEYHEPTEFYLYEVENESMVRFLTKNVDVLVTPEHDMWIRRSNKSPHFTKIKAQEAPTAQFFFAAAVNYDGNEDVKEFVLPSTVRWVGTAREDLVQPRHIKMDDFLEFLGYFISEGGLSATEHWFTLSQHASHEGNVGTFDANHIDFDIAIANIGSHATRYREGDQYRWTVADKQLCDWLRDNVGVHSHEKSIPREFFKCSKRQLKILFTALMAGDGSWDKRENRNNGYYSSTSATLADDVQELAFLLGYCASVGVHYEAHGNRRKMYRVSISTRREHSLMGTAQSMTKCGVRREAYTGSVYCFNVPNHLFVTRRNGKIGIHGNTAQNAQQTAEEEGLYPLMSWWKDDIMDYIIQKQFGFEDVEFTFLPKPETDQKKRAEVHQILFNIGVEDVNEIRDEYGMEPIEDGDVHFLVAGGAPVPLSGAASGQIGQPGDPQNPGNPKPQSSPQGGRSKAQPGLAKSPLETLIDDINGLTKRHVTKKDVKDAAKESDGDIDRASHLQLKVGNYKKGHIYIQGLNITIENEKGSYRGEKDQHGKKWQVKMPTAYGYIRCTMGADNMQMDVYLGKHPMSKTVWVIDQDKVTNTGANKGFDEHKVMLGYSKLKRALKDYLKSHFDGHGHERIHNVVELSMDEFKRWLKKGDMKAPISDQGYGDVVLTQNEVKKADTISQSTGLMYYDQNPAGRKKKKKSRLKSGPRWMELVA